ncbi:hypothetical protein A8H39_01140 [Paraburkholderia fungorum]|uniref:hypothetical protein n=1 Tax=Paraburkholderia fungorum TaxID=134537 RepID=UPI00047F5A81|nr:hypothetical protein [Paraburkholderia fungorum]MBB5547468.1 hypothetical protein [Paraburkholderia fungorum]PNE59781.1 hypothetical protein A8H39_01140 [Paraburkholderia fungorum]
MFEHKAIMRVHPLYKRTLSAPVLRNRASWPTADHEAGVVGIVLYPEDGEHQTVEAAATCGFALCLIVDLPRNTGVSATKGFASYARAIASTQHQAIDDIAWFGLDSVGNFDAVSLQGEYAEFSSIVQPGHVPRSLSAFMERVEHMFGTAPDIFVRTVTAMLKDLS